MKENSKFADFLEKGKKRTGGEKNVSVVAGKKTLKKKKVTKAFGRRSFFVRKTNQKTKGKKVFSRKVSGKKKSVVSFGFLKRRRLTGVEELFLDKIINFFGVALLVLVPLVFLGGVTGNFVLVKEIIFMGVVTVMLFLFLVKGFFSGEIRLRKVGFFKYFVPFLVLVLTTVWLSVDRWHSLIGARDDFSRGYVFLFLMVIFFVVLLNTINLSVVRRVFWILVGEFAFLGVYVLLAELNVMPRMIQRYFVLDVFTSLSDLRLILGSGLVFSLFGLIILISGKFKKLLYFLLLTINICLIFDLVFFLGGDLIFGSLAVVVLLGWYFLGRQRKIRKGNFYTFFTKGFLLLSVFVLLTWPMISLFGQGGSFVGPMDVAVARDAMPLSEEWRLLQNSVFSGWRQFIVGTGPATIKYALVKFVDQGSPVEKEALKVSFVGELFLTVGVIGLVLFLFWCLVFLSVFVRAVVKTAKEVDYYLLAFGLSSLFLLVNGILNYVTVNIWLYSFLVFIFAFLYALLILKKRLFKKDYIIISTKSFSWRYLAYLLFLFFVLIGIGFGIVYYNRAFWAEREFVKFSAGGYSDQEITSLRRATELNPLEYFYYLRLGEIYLKKILQEKKDVFVGKVDIQNDNLFIQFSNATQKARLLSGGSDWRLYNLLTKASFLSDDKHLREQSLNKLKELNADSAELYEFLGDAEYSAFINSGSLEGKDDVHIKKAIAFYEQALKIDPDFSAIYYKMAKISLYRHDLRKALYLIGEAERFASKEKEGDYRFLRAVILQNKCTKEDRREAEKIYNHLLKTKGKDVAVFLQLGLLAEQEGDFATAKKYYSRIITLLNGDRSVDNFLQVLRKFIVNVGNEQSNLNYVKILWVDFVRRLDSGKIKLSLNDKEGELATDSDSVEFSERSTGLKRDLKGRFVVVDVAIEGPVNVRSLPSLSGKKLTKIKKTAKFKELARQGKWVKILVPKKSEGEKDIEGWVFGRFVKKQAER